MLIMITFGGVSVFGLIPPGTGNGSIETGNAGIIEIESLRRFGELEKPSVRFPHDQHTESLLKQKKDCLACHQKKDGKLVLQFMRQNDPDRKALMDIYHGNCIGCHKTAMEQGAAAGPIVCAECHRKKAEKMPRPSPMGMDKSLHYRHSKAYSNKCETCHHEYDPKEKKLFYRQGEEGSCRYCHGQVTVENRSSFRLAAHQGCIGCHLERTGRNEVTGPFTCDGCHNPVSQQKIAKALPVPRLERKQPELVMIRTGDSVIDSGVKNRMAFVPFNHRAHEECNDTCRSCHHADLKKCNSCHSPYGHKDGNFIRLESAMHDPGAMRSCKGCHAGRQENQSCAGCHSLASAKHASDEASCVKCHITDSSEAAGSKTAAIKDSDLAEPLLKNRVRVSGTYQPDKIPEKVVIQRLSAKYEPVSFPHRKIVEALSARVADNALAGYFHQGKGTICKGCHHNGQADETPSSCASCHGRENAENDPQKPGLLGAYHIQCLNCHRVMGLEKPESCTDCHKAKTQ